MVYVSAPYTTEYFFGLQMGQEILLVREVFLQHYNAISSNKQSKLQWGHCSIGVIQY